MAGLIGEPAACGNTAMLIMSPTMPSAMMMMMMSVVPSTMLMS